MGSPNGGIIGVVNPTSFGKDTVTIKTSTCSSVPLQPGTTIIKSAIIAGGGGRWITCWWRWWSWWF
jgi:hypothetical protein